jgi:hypothetical protein
MVRCRAVASPTPAELGVKGGEARRSAPLAGWPSYPQITVAAGGDDAKAAVRAWPRVKSASISMVAALDRPGHSHQPVKKSSVIESSVCKIQRDDRNKCSSR